MISAIAESRSAGQLEAEEGPECLWGGTRGGGSEEESGRSITAVKITSKTARPTGRAAATRRK